MYFAGRPLSRPGVRQGNPTPLVRMAPAHARADAIAHASRVRLKTASPAPRSASIARLTLTPRKCSFRCYPTQKLTKAEQTSLRSIRAMQVNHEEVDTVLGGRRKRIEDKMKQMQRGVEAQSKGWSEVGAVSSGGSTGSPAKARRLEAGRMAVPLCDLPRFLRSLPAQLTRRPAVPRNAWHARPLPPRSSWA